MALFARRRWLLPAAAALVVSAGAAVVLAAHQDGPAPLRDAVGDEIVESASPLPEPTIPAIDVRTLPAGSLRTYYERPVVARGVPVVAVVGPSIAWLATSPDHRVLLLLAGVEHPFTFPAGTRLTFTGTVHAVAPAFVRSLDMSAADEAEADRQGVYVEVADYAIVR